jgi:hypothetical protein
LADTTTHGFLWPKFEAERCALTYMVPSGAETSRLPLVSVIQVAKEILIQSSVVSLIFPPPPQVRHRPVGRFYDLVEGGAIGLLGRSGESTPEA